MHAAVGSPPGEDEGGFDEVVVVWSFGVVVVGTHDKHRYPSTAEKLSGTVTMEVGVRHDAHDNPEVNLVLIGCASVLTVPAAGG